MGKSTLVWLQIAGLNAPIPGGATFGYQAGGWGKPPVNEDGIPLYGDVFGERRADDDDDAVRLPWILVPSPEARSVANDSSSTAERGLPCTCARLRTCCRHSGNCDLAHAPIFGRTV